MLDIFRVWCSVDNTIMDLVKSNFQNFGQDIEIGFMWSTL